MDENAGTRTRAPVTVLGIALSAILSCQASVPSPNETDDIPALIAALGAERVETRMAAKERLLRIGLRAREALEGAANSPEVDLRTLARDVLDEIVWEPGFKRFDEAVVERCKSLRLEVLGREQESARKGGPPGYSPGTACVQPDPVKANARAPNPISHALLKEIFPGYRFYIGKASFVVNQSWSRKIEGGAEVAGSGYNALVSYVIAAEEAGRGLAPGHGLTMVAELARRSGIRMETPAEKKKLVEALKVLGLVSGGFTYLERPSDAERSSPGFRTYRFDLNGGVRTIEGILPEQR